MSLEAEKCKDQLLLEEITYSTFQNSRDLKRDIRMYQLISHHASEFKKVILLQLVNVDHSQRQ